MHFEFVRFPRQPAHPARLSAFPLSPALRHRVDTRHWWPQTGRPKLQKKTSLAEACRFFLLPTVSARDDREAKFQFSADRRNRVLSSPHSEFPLTPSASPSADFGEMYQKSSPSTIR